MKIILLQDVPKVGHKYDVKNVASGFAANFLFPRKLAELASDKKIKNIETRQLQAKEERKIQDTLLEKNIEALKNVSIEITEKSNEQGHLFKGVHKEEIVKALKEQGHIDINPDFIVLEQPIKEIGEYEITVKVEDQTEVFKLVIV